MEPSAVHKARSLDRFTRGCRKESTHVTITDREAWEFLEWYGGTLGDCPPFEIEMKRARATHDPWPMLIGMEIVGFSIARIEEETH